MHHLTCDLVEECLSSIPRSSAAGVDGMTVDQARKNAEWLLPPLVHQIHQGQYKAPPVRRVFIPKSEGKQRPIGVPEVIDRALQAGVTRILNEIYEQDFLTCSFGFRPNRGCHHALGTIKELLDHRKMNYALEVDTRDFFGSLSHEWLGKFLRLRIGDERIHTLIKSWLKAGVMEKNNLQTVDVGTPQGGSISPLLANIYLHYVLDLWFEKKVKKQLRGKAQLVRYADDFIILFKDQKDMESMQSILKARLAQFGLAIAEEKTHMTDLTPRPNQGGKVRRRITFLGFNIFRALNRRKTGWKVVFQTEGKRYTRAKAAMRASLSRMMHWELERQAARINAILSGHYNYYGLAGNTDRLRNFFNETVLYWRCTLSRRSQRGRMNWVKMREVLAKYPLRNPRVKLTYQELAAYVRL